VKRAVQAWRLYFTPGGGGTGVGPSTQSTGVQSVQINFPFILVFGGRVAA